MPLSVLLRRALERVEVAETEVPVRAGKTSHIAPLLIYYSFNAVRATQPCFPNVNAGRVNENFRSDSDRRREILPPIR